MGKKIFLPDLNLTPTPDKDDESSSVAVDRLSKLPEPLIHVILSFLPMRYVVRTALFSKRWQHLWTSIPYLHFQFDPEKDSFNFPDFVENALARWNGEKILKFGIDLFTIEYDRNAVDSWLLFAVEKQVEELFVKFIYTEHLLPDAVYSCSSIKKLSLNYLDLAAKETVNWNQLNSLTIHLCYFNEEDVLNQILLSVPRLEVLNLRTEPILLGNLNIRSTSLKILNISYVDIGDYEVEAPTIARISAPFLQSLEFAGIRYTSCLLKVLSLTNANLDFDMILTVELSWRIEVGEMLGDAVLGISHAVKLTSNKWSLMLLVDESKDDTVVLFSNAKFLKLCAVDAGEMLNVLEMFPKLEMLIVEHIENEEYNPMVSDTTCSRPSLLHLKRVGITWCAHDVSIFPVMNTIWETAPLLEEMVLQRS